MRIAPAKSRKALVPPMTFFRLSAVIVAALWISSVVATEPGENTERIERRWDFSSVEQMQNLNGAGYRWSQENGAGGVPGVLLSENVGPQDGGLYVMEEAFDLRRGKVELSVSFRADGTNGPGTARIFFGFGQRPETSLATGDAKIGVRIFKSEKPRFPDAPWILQLVNGVATREIGKQFALRDGHWYLLRLTLAMSGDRATWSWEAELRDCGEKGEKPGSVVHGGAGTTPVLGNYDAQEMFAGLVGQRNRGGATAFDDLIVIATPDRTDTVPLQPVTFLPASLPDRRAPAHSMFGVCGHFMHTKLFYPDSDKSDYWQPDYTLPFLLEGGFGWVREPLYQPWFDDVSNPRAVANRRRVEEYLALYEKHGVGVLLVPMSFPPGKSKHEPFREPFFEWIGELAAKFRCVRAVEMHNEPNLKFFWGGTAKDYVTVYRRAAGIIRARAPEVDIVIGSTSSMWWKPGVDWLKIVLDEGALEWGTAVSTHPYNGKRPPETDPWFDGAPPETPDHLDRAIAAFHALVGAKAPEGRKPALYFTELGYSAAREGLFAINDENLQADYLSRLMLMYFAARLNGLPLKAVFWYDLKNDGTGDHMEAHFGLVSFDTSRVKPAYDAYRRIARFFQNPADFQPVPLAVRSSNWDDAVKRYVWKRSDGALVLPVWRLEQRQPQRGDFATELSVTLPDGFRPSRVILHDLNEQEPRAIGFAEKDGQLAVPLRLSRRAAWLEIFPREG